ncbi:glutamate carboxypeptidase [Actinoplanes lutulentus]|uniref:Glutamate carboxypeptidase n=1 Tax=Actinoplanes lutulentus TaxID=1287878 RepID=A0A327ZI22_9ACTN|nr:M20/M25/M40 family metallo-hydrolase [Actinoplanes lutulentus]MBB2946829.1 glutamate carboxypeptidase [Actinoplanes lutulentus]RAK35721.1 glutamate carboxypeptidase [Actinoplanes lutulentus]
MLYTALEALHRYTLLESPTGDPVRLGELAEVLEADAARAGFTVTREPHPTGDHLLWSIPSTGSEGAPTLLLTHYDTVWPVGTLETMPWSVESDVIRGPGVYDTKAGIAALLESVTGLTTHPEIRVIVVADEEIGSPTAGDLVRSEAGRAGMVLGLEPPHPGGDLKTGRRGSTRARIEVTGVEAHAALDPDAGANAIDELIDQLLRVRAGVADRPVLLNTGTIAGGGRTNVVAGSAYADLGLRFVAPEDEEAVISLLTDLRPVNAKAEVTTTLLSRRPTWRPSPPGADLLQRITMAAAGIGQQIGGRPADGAADTNTTGSLGVPTVDGLAPRGGGAHARTEWVSAIGVGERVALLGALLAG